MDLEVQAKKITCKNIKKNLYLITPNGEIWSNYLKSFMQPKTDKDGYLIIGLRTEENKQKMFRIHQLVMLTYGELPSENLFDPTINHIDGNKINNNISNLEWIDRKTNTSIRFDKPIGEKNHFSKLKESQVLEIIDLLSNTNLSLSQIAKKYNVSKSAISSIKRGTTWKHINPFRA